MKEQLSTSNSRARFRPGQTPRHWTRLVRLSASSPRLTSRSPAGTWTPPERLGGALIIDPRLELEPVLKAVGPERRPLAPFDAEGPNPAKPRASSGLFTVPADSQECSVTLRRVAKRATRQLSTS